MANSNTTEDLVTQYAEDFSIPGDWQKDYRYGAFYIFPPDGLRQRVNSLRDTHDPESQSYCDAHISLTVPLPRPVTRQHWAELRRVVEHIPSFTIEYGPVISYPGVPGVVIQIQPFERLDKLVRSLESATVFSDAKARPYPFSPHITIAEFVTLDRTAQLVEELQFDALIGEFSCSSIAYAVPDRSFHFEEREWLELRG